MRHLRLVPLGITLLLLGAARRDPPREWPAYGGDRGSTHYSPLDQIDRTNVARLEVAWTYHTGDARESGSQIQCNPIVVRGVLYATSPGLKAFALDAETGRELWTFDPFAGGKPEDTTNRGVVYWESGDDRRILYTAGARLFALDAATGKPVASFGTNGVVDLREGLGRDVSDLYLVATSPGVIYRDLLIQGTRVAEDERAAPGSVRAFDVRTGKIRWTFHTIPQPGEYGHDTWPNGSWKYLGGANSWAGLSVDSARGVAYVPTGSASPDFYGGTRLGQNLFANSLLALDAATGKRLWHFQTIHHDVFDRDLPAPPTLVTVRHAGRPVDAVAQITKSGFVFLFDRATGKPLFPIEERPAPKSTLLGERTWPTQPVPTKPAPFVRQRFTEEDVTDVSPDRDSVLKRLHTLRGGTNMWTPPSVEGTIAFPGFDGGADWGGAAFDPATGLLYVNANEMPWVARVIPRAAPNALGTGRVASGASLYSFSCARCHGADMKGDGARTPSLVGVSQRLSRAEVMRVVTRGRGFMPAFASLTAAQRAAVVDYVTGARDTTPAKEPVSAPNARGVGPAPSYDFAGYERFLDPEGHPAIKPPWGTLNAIDLNRGEIVWKVPLGEWPELKARGVPPTGTDNYGGPIVTAGGLVFIGASKDETFRAFDKTTGKILWETKLPASGHATPATYEVNGRQYVVIAAGGGKGTKPGDAYVAFALPKR